MVCFTGPHAGTAQTTPAPPLHFDIFTVKPNKGGGDAMSMSWHDNVFSATHVNLKFMLQVAFNIRQALLENVPKWGGSEYWDIQGKVSEYDPEVAKNLTNEQRRVMQQEFLAHAFGLREHMETRVQPLYELVIAKGGSKMTENTVDPKSPDAKGKTGNMRMSGEMLEAQGITMENLCKSLEGVVERNIVDKTGLTGKYDVKLHWLPEARAAAADADEQPGIFAALQEQLGLRLQPAKGEANVLVVDAAVLPAEE